MTLVSFMSANLVARELGWRMPSWEAGQRATQEAFAPIETFERKFDEVLAIAQDLGFTGVDVWNAHLDPDWATDDHLDICRGLLERREMRVASLAGWFGSTRERFAAACRIAVAVGAPVLGGGTSLVETDRDFVVDELGRNGLRLAIENHPERSPAEMVAKIGADGDATIGTAVDTGWYATQGYDAERAIEELDTYVFHVHLKDVRHSGTPHQTCGYGEGVVPLRECVSALRRIGYAGAISVENHAGDRDPRPEIAASRSLLEGWLAEEGESA